MGGQLVVEFLGQKRIGKNLLDSLDAVEMARVGSGFHFSKTKVLTGDRQDR